MISITAFRPTSRRRSLVLGIAYNIKKTNTVLRISYARTLESPFNENLSSQHRLHRSRGQRHHDRGPGLFVHHRPLTPGFRNEFHAGLQQAFGKYFV